MKHIAILSVIVFALGCAAIDAKKLENDVKNYTQIIDAVCTTSEIFSYAGKEIPAVDQCKQVLKTANIISGYGDTLAITDTLRCVEEYDVKSEKFVLCLRDVKWWPILADQINRAAARSIDK